MGALQSRYLIRFTFASSVILFDNLNDVNIQLEGNYPHFILSFDVYSILL